MTFRVLWVQGALDDMATLWINADSRTRADITRAAHGLEKQLAKDPFAICESRDPGEWVCFCDPLGLLVEIDSSLKIVWILSVWRFG
jgi:hypothetical protein